MYELYKLKYKTMSYRDSLIGIYFMSRYQNHLNVAERKLEVIFIRSKNI